MVNLSLRAQIGAFRMDISGFRLLKGHLTQERQHGLIERILAILEDAPPFKPRMPRTGRPFSVSMSNAGPLGWVADKAGYRYQDTHPVTGSPWPDIPPELIDLWFVAGGYNAPPEACLINLYNGPKTRMGLHVDRDEDDKNAPILSVSLGDSSTFRIGGRKRSDKTTSVELASGDVLIMEDEARHAYHGLDRIKWGSSDLVPGGGRINLTLRRVTEPPVLP